MSAAAAAANGQSWHYSTNTETAVTWATPRSLYLALDAEFRFDVDVAADPSTAQHVRYFTKDTDALAQPWRGLSVFCNPPYGRQLDRWVRKAALETRELGCPLAVLVLPARTGNKWFHRYVKREAEIRFIEGRLGFVLPGGVQGRKNSAKFDSMVCVYRADRRGAGTIADQLLFPFLRRVVQ